MNESELLADPVAQFMLWYSEATKDLDAKFPDACCLSTVSSTGDPEGRMVLLRGCSESGFTFFTNSRSRKGLAMSANPRAALTFYWDHAGRQVRVEGDVELLNGADSDSYFSSRPLGSQLGAWASQQSEVLSSRDELERRVEAFAEKFARGAVPRPPHWNGYLLRPKRIEFWEAQPDRLHDRIEYLYEAEKTWRKQRLNP